MKITVDIDENCKEDQVVIKCKEVTEEIISLQKTINDLYSDNMELELFNGGKEYYVSVKDIIFFQTDGEIVKAHTKDEIFDTRYRLYELELLLPHYFVRISKSAIVNSKEIYAITRNLTASSQIEFKNTHKHIFVSRGYYKPLKSKIDEMRNIR